jgi:glycosyltransferase involved in cell wall biosynthesis
VRLHHNVSVVYVSADATLKPGEIIADSTVFEGIREYRIYFGKHKSEFLNAIEYLRHYLRGISMAEKSGGTIDISHVHVLTRAAVPAFWLKITRGIPYLITEHWSRYLPENVRQGAYRGCLRKWVTRVVVAHASRVTTVTKNLADSMQKLGLRNEYVITPNVADTNVFRPGELHATGRKKLIHVSCFDEPAKNIKGIINVVAALSKERSDFTLDIVGDGRDFREVKIHADQTGLVDKVIFFRGLLTGEPLYKSMREADALIMFSNYENLPCTIVESMCCGVPVVSTRVGGIAEYLGPGAGILVQPGNEPELTGAVENILNGKTPFDRESMRQYAMQHFSLEASGNLFNQIYLESLSRRH